MGRSKGQTILVVDDDREVADAYAVRLNQRYDDVQTTDVVLLDRRIPYSGDKVLKDIRQWGHNCRVIMITAVDPDFSIVDMPFDD